MQSAEHEGLHRHQILQAQVTGAGGAEQTGNAV